MDDKIFAEAVFDGSALWGYSDQPTIRDVSDVTDDWTRNIFSLTSWEEGKLLHVKFLPDLSFW